MVLTLRGRNPGVVVYIGVFRSNEVRGRGIEANRTDKGKKAPGGAPIGGGCATDPLSKPVDLLVSHLSSFFRLEISEA
jgi:hypothetical protein